MNNVKILWKSAENTGQIRASYGTLATDCGKVSGSVTELDFAQANVKLGPNATIVHVEAGKTPFSFFLRDVTVESPIYLPAAEVVVTTAEDGRSYEQIVADIAAKGGKTVRQQVLDDEEYSYERAASETRNLRSTAWLGVSKDMRIFQMNLRCREFGRDLQTMDEIVVSYYDRPHTAEQLPELAGKTAYSIYMMTGRGIGCKDQITRQLMDGYMPILLTEDSDDGIIYHSTSFVTMEKSPLKSENLRGTDMFVADSYGFGAMQTEKHQERANAALQDELYNQAEEPVLCIRIVAENTRKAPTYAFLKTPDPLPGCIYGPNPDTDRTELNPETGYLSFASSGRVAVIGTIDGAPIPAVETSVLIPAKSKVVFEFKIPHTPISPERADALAKVSMEEKLAEAKEFWANEIKDAAEITLPEKRIEEMIKAGLLHMDVGFFGKNPDGAILPIVGRYTPIGSESSPLIQFLDAVGMKEMAERSIQYFVEKQHDNGFIQNFGGYMLETGSTLWTMGEHFRMTKDVEWVKSVKECVVKAADYLIRWREENLGEELKGGKGYGMIKGKVADPEDHFHAFMLNAGAYAGLYSAGELLQCCDPEKAAYYTELAATMRENIRESFFRNVELSPVLPAADGTWFRSFAPWCETIGPLCVHAECDKIYTHGAFTTRDYIGANYLLLQGVLDADEPVVEDMLSFFTEFLTLNNTCFSQPYYSVHPYAQLLRGDVKLFLQEFYSGFSGLADRETYSFWEHYFLASPHKLHEEGWFLMRCRWMLAIEEYKKGTLKLMAGIPSAWMKDGERISVKHMKTYYGDLSFTAQSNVASGNIHVSVSLDSEGFEKPAQIIVRVPHPAGLKATSVSMGVYDPETEAVTLDGAADSLEFDVKYHLIL